MTELLGPDLWITAAQLYRYSLPFRRETTTAAGRFSSRQGHLIRLVDNQGRSGWGDAATWPGFTGSTFVTIEDSLLHITKKNGPLLRRRFPDLRSISQWLSAQSLIPEVAYALELSLLDLLGQALGRPISHILGSEPQQSVMSSIGVASTDEIRGATRDSSVTFKVKVGALSLAEDEERLGKLRAVIGPEPRIRVDANGAWSLEEAESALERLNRFNLEWIEQPVAMEDLDEFLAPRRWETPIAADESVLWAQKENRALPAADVLVLKPMFLGGLLIAQNIARAAKQSHPPKKIAVSCAWESVIGRTGALHLAATLAEDTAAGLSSPMASDVASLKITDSGQIRVPQTPGLGLKPRVRVLELVS